MCCRGWPRGRGIHVGRYIIAGRIFPRCLLILFPPFIAPHFQTLRRFYVLAGIRFFFSKAIFIPVYKNDFEIVLFFKNDFEIVFTNTISKSFFSRTISEPFLTRTISKSFFKKLIPKSFLRKTISKSFYFSKTISKSSFRKTKSFFKKAIPKSFFRKTISKSFYFSNTISKSFFSRTISESFLKNKTIFEIIFFKIDFEINFFFQKRFRNHFKIEDLNK